MFTDFVTECRAHKALSGARNADAADLGQSFEETFEQPVAATT
jgi:hypothetical protein